ncbi:MAG: carboxylate-amine ligase [Pseudolabrys sp.]|nr:carboxylate-amine ligase [Pseudolabrys sp.]
MELCSRARVIARMYTIGIEEEYFVFDAKTRRALQRADKKFLASVQKSLGKQVSTEMLQSQIEVMTTPCETMDEARTQLTHLRGTLGEAAKARKLGIAAMGTFPLAFWPEQKITEKERYDTILDDLQMIGARNMLCGMHVHVGVPDLDSRINLMMRLTPYLPLLLALSTSSPFWQGHLTGLSGYRLAAYDEMPRTGLPELFRTNEDYDEYVAALVGAKIIPDASYIWWAIRPSLRNPTIELRVADTCTRVEDALAIAALFRCLVRSLDRNRGINAGFDRVGRAITAENKWHAQRSGIAATFIDPFSRQPISIKQWLGQVRSFIADDIDALGCKGEIGHLDKIVSGGTSADRQIGLFTDARAAGRQRLTAVKDVIDWVGEASLATGQTVP